MTMNAMVVYESVYGNTRAVAEAIAEGLGGATVLPVSQAAGRVAQAELLVVGGPTHMHGLATTRSRHMAAAAAQEEAESVELDPFATAEPGLRRWLDELSDGHGARAATFDTRLDRSPWLTGVASRGIAKRLRRRGYEVLGTGSFLVEDSEGPLAPGERDRARAWGAQLLATGVGGAERRPLSPLGDAA
jgi:Flavodoxin domain